METLKQFSQKLFHYIHGELRGLNLTAIKDEEEFLIKQVEDSLQPFYISNTLKDNKNLYFLDVGFGGGFPLIPLAKCFPEKFFLGIDGRAKKVNGVKKIIEYLQLKNVQVLHYRLEDIYIDYKIILLFKAVGKVSEILPLVSGISGVKCFFLKGQNFNEQEGIIGSIGPVRQFPQFTCIENTSYEIPESNIQRILVGYELVHNHLQNVTKRLVKISELF